MNLGGRPPGRALGLVMASAVIVLFTACATVPGTPPPPKEDPWENFNRKVYSFNESVDEAVLKPVAEAYRKVVPELVRTGVSNVLGNVGDVWSAANHLLQGKIHAGLDMGMRVLTNTVFGLGGLLDPASEMGLTRRSEDFGQTLGRWGVGTGPYLVLPLLGPSTLRDSGALLVDRQASVSSYINNETAAYGVTALEIVNLRASLLGASRLLDSVALDKYSFLRQAFLSRRLDAVYDGAPPLENFDEEPESAVAPIPGKLAPAPAPAPAPASPPQSSRK